MPEVWFTVEWPDGSSEVCYSPSTVVTRYFAAGEQYPLADFLTRARRALTEAGDRVLAKYGYRCTGADEQLGQIERAAARFSIDAGVVKVLDIKGTPGERRRV
jgi:uncharacterized repeat protein (TIGR04042 family)